MKTLSFIAVAIYCASASAQTSTQCNRINNRPGFMSNVSSAGLASQASPVTVCTVINSLEATDSTTAFFAEAPDGDAVMEIFYTQEPKYPQVASSFPSYPDGTFPTKRYDNYYGRLSVGETKLLEDNLRLPGSKTDAAALLRSYKDYYGQLLTMTFYTYSIYDYSFGVCARGYPKTGTSWTAVSITNLGPSKSSACYQLVGDYFEK